MRAQSDWRKNSRSAASKHRFCGAKLYPRWLLDTNDAPRIGLLAPYACGPTVTPSWIHSGETHSVRPLPSQASIAAAAR